MADSESPHDAEIPDDLQRRLDLVKLQIAELFNLNRKLRTDTSRRIRFFELRCPTLAYARTNFEHLSVAMLYVRRQLIELGR